jgi:hypothetical protein
MNVHCPSSSHIDKGEVEDFSIGDTVHFTLMGIRGIVQKVGKTFLIIETFNKKKDALEVANVPKNKCYLLEEAEETA